MSPSLMRLIFWSTENDISRINAAIAPPLSLVEAAISVEAIYFATGGTSVRVHNTTMY